MIPRYSILSGDAALNIASWCRPETFDACYCDPPYGFAAFTHKRKTMAWEREDVPDTSVWDGVWRVLKPGSLLMAASGARLYHRMATRIEDAGFYILDQFNWIYSGANATGVVEGQRLRPAVEPYVVAWKPSQRVGRRFNTKAGVRGLPSDVALDPLLMEALAFDNPLVDRFFFCGKAGPSERIKGDDHPTHKPLALCEHMAALMRPAEKKRRILVPFSGVGSEMIGCLRAGWPEVVGLERERKYVAVAHKRIAKFAPEAKLMESFERMVA